MEGADKSTVLWRHPEQLTENISTIKFEDGCICQCFKSKVSLDN